MSDQSTADLLRRWAALGHCEQQFLLLHLAQAEHDGFADALTAVEVHRIRPGADPKAARLCVSLDTAEMQRDFFAGLLRSVATGLAQGDLDDALAAQAILDAVERALERPATIHAASAADRERMRAGEPR
jgi:hypothetical protein